MAEYYGNICTCRKCNGIVHTIKRGDTLYLLSRYYNVTINEIMRANANINVYNLQIGDQICIPVRRPAPTPPMSPLPQRPGTGMNPPQVSPPRPEAPGIPPVIQPRDNNDRNDDRDDDIEDFIEDLLENNNRQNKMQMDENDIGNIDNRAVSVNVSEIYEKTPCCGGMKVKDVFKDENMTLEELAKILKNV